MQGENGNAVTIRWISGLISRGAQPVLLDKIAQGLHTNCGWLEPSCVVQWSGLPVGALLTSRFTSLLSLSSLRILTQSCRWFSVVSY